MYRLQGRCPYRPGARIHFFSRTFFVPYIFFSVHFLFRTFLNTAYTHIAWCPHCFFFVVLFFLRQQMAQVPGRTMPCVFYTQTHDALCFLHTNTRCIVFFTHTNTNRTQRARGNTGIHTYTHTCMLPRRLLNFIFQFSFFYFFIFYFFILRAPSYL